MKTRFLYDKQERSTSQGLPSPLCRTSTSNAAEAELSKSSKTQITLETVYSLCCHLVRASAAWWQKLRLTVRSHRRRRERQNWLWSPCQRRCRKIRWRSDDRTLVLYLKEPKRKQACWSCADWSQVGYKLTSLNILIVKVRNWSMERAL